MMVSSSGRKYDVTIVGASIAGATLALQLGRAGISTCLIDKATFPRRKPCGEGLSGEGYSTLVELGMEDLVRALPHKEFFGFSIWDGETARQIEFDAPISKSRSIAVARECLDSAIVDAAKRCSSVNVEMGAQVREISRTEKGFEVRWNVNGEKRSIPSRFVVLADGINSFGAEQLGLKIRAGTKNRYGYSMVYRARFKQPLRHVHIFLGKEAEFYCAQVDDETLSVCILSTKQGIQNAIHSEKIANRCAAVAAKMQVELGECTSAIGVGPLGNMRRDAICDGGMLIGDACESFDPIAGMGMTHALVSAKLASKALIDIFATGISPEVAFAEYERRRAQVGRQMRGITRLTYFALKYPERARPIHLLGWTQLPRLVTSWAHRPDRASWSQRLVEPLLAVVGSR